jgi:hypothetical protein
MRSATATSDRPGAQITEALHETTVAWLDELPGSVQPRRLARDFPRIANTLCELWRRPSLCDVYFDQLIFDDRGGRAGFRPQIMKELGALAAHYGTVYPSGHSAWLVVRNR